MHPDILKLRLPHPSTPLPWPDEAPVPHPSLGWPAGLIAWGHDLSPQRLEEAYLKGIFPWYSDGEPVLWWSTDPRMVLAVDQFRLHDSLRKTLKRSLQSGELEIRFDHSLPDVMAACAQIERPGQSGTWIQPELTEAYLAWAAQGAVHSVEAWWQGELAGGLYGVNLGRMFYGESMFSRRTDASKWALCALVAHCRRHGIEWIDCQQQTAHLAHMGGRPLPRRDFLHRLRQLTMMPTRALWQHDPQDWRWLDPRLAPADGPTP